MTRRIPGQRKSEGLGSLERGAVCEAFGALFDGGSEDAPAGKINLRINSTDEIDPAIEHGDAAPTKNVPLPITYTRR